jgi:hypothetical protein
MRESNELNDPLADKLGRFTPDTTGLDRDALLFQAGRASVHPPRVWPALAGVLALSQAVTLLIFLTHSPEGATPVVITPTPATPSVEQESNSNPSSEDVRQWTYRRAILSGNIDDLPRQPPIDNAVASGKVLTVLSLSAVLVEN